MSAIGFLKSVLGDDGATALAKASKRVPSLGSVLVPRAIMSWLSTAIRISYEGEIPGLDNSYIALQKSDDGFSGALTIGDSVHTFEGSDTLHVAAAIGVALGIDDSGIDPLLKNTDLTKIGQSIDLLVKARVLSKVAVQELTPSHNDSSDSVDAGGDTSFDFGFNAPNEEQSDSFSLARAHANRMRHPANKELAHAWINHCEGKAPRPAGIHPAMEKRIAMFGVVDPTGFAYEENGRSMHRQLSSKKGRGPVQAQPAELARHRAMSLTGRDPGYQKTELEKRVLDPAAGYTFTHEHHDLGDGDMLTHIKAHGPDGSEVGGALFNHHPAGHLEAEGVKVHPEHQRKGIASAIYSHAQKLTGKAIAPSHDQTAAGKALWAGNSAAPQFGKGEHAMAAAPKGPKEPEAPQAPVPVSRSTTLKPKLPVLKTELPIKKSESEYACPECGGRQFKQDRFVGCMCFRALAKSVTTKTTAEGYVLSLSRSDWDEASVQSLVSALKR